MNTDWVAILVHDDILALRYALACAHKMPGVSIVVTIFDQTIGDELRRLLKHCEVTSPAELALSQLVELCLTGRDVDEAHAISGLIDRAAVYTCPYSCAVPDLQA